MVKHHLTHRHPGWRKSIVDPGHRRAAVVPRAAHRVDHEVPRRRVGDPRSSCRCWSCCCCASTASTATEAVDLEHEVPGGGHGARSCAATSCSCSSTASTPPPPAAIQYARTLTPDELRAVHFVLDDARRPRAGRRSGAGSGLQRVPLELVACPDRRLTRAAVECVARELSDGETEVSRAPARAEVQGRLAPRAPRPHGRGDPGAGVAPRPRQRHDASRSTSAPGRKPWRAAAPRRHAARAAAAVPPGRPGRRPRLQRARPPVVEGRDADHRRQLAPAA